MDKAKASTQIAAQWPEAPPSKPSVPWIKGYFAFPPTITPDGRVTFTFAVKQPAPEELRIAQEREARAASEAEAREQARLKEQAWQERLQREAQQREEQLARERAEALKGEMEWVRMGNSLRDAYGRRDKARTEHLRAEVRLLDEERQLMALWDAYEARWRELLSMNAPVSFRDVPWPLPVVPGSVDEFTPAAVEEFLFGPLRVRSNTVTKRERIRTSLLRWHPDKVSVMLQRVVQEDAEAVREGVHAVFRCLKALQDTERQS